MGGPGPVTGPFVTGGPPLDGPFHRRWTHDTSAPLRPIACPDGIGGLIGMCLGFPGLVVAVDANGATVETDGRRRRANTLLLPDLAVGEWVFVAAGTVIERLDPGEAADISDQINEARQEDRHDDRT